ncbi:MAG: ATP-binding cassette domain-containing protein [Dehalococcoidia bacterium]|nr:ATP-binding cassette domain-containing protein [Dehalococcoidia bacterium]
MPSTDPATQPARAGIAESTPAAVQVRGLSVRRGGRLVLPGIDLDVRGGVVTGLLGPSGSGKTTLIRAIVGVQVIEGGTVQVLGEPAGSPGLRRRVAYVTQTPSVYGDLTVTENLRYFAGVLGAPPASVERAVEVTGLRQQAKQIAGSLSGGECSRASLAVALLGDPELIVLDEPTVGLDPALRRDLWRTFHDLAARGASLIVSTHVMDEADRCDELVLMREGRVAASAPPAALLEQTRTASIEDAFLALAASPTEAS